MKASNSEILQVESVPATYETPVLKHFGAFARVTLEGGPGNGGDMFTAHVHDDVS